MDYACGDQNIQITDWYAQGQVESLLVISCGVSWE